MYNRYVPQPDGSFRRSRMPDQSRPAARPSHPPRPAPEPEPCEPPPCPPQPEPCPPPPPKQHSCPPRQEPCRDRGQEGSVGGFLRSLLPKDFDTGDLLIILLLLLMAGDCPEDQNTALLTLALYLFM